MSRIWFSVGLSAIVALITMLVGFLSEVRLLIVLYRMFISLVIFGIIGYILSGIFPKLLTDFLKTSHDEISPNHTPAGQNEDSAENPSEPILNQEFQPLNSGKLERVYSGEK